MEKQLILSAVVVFMIFRCAFAGTYSGGTGEPNDPYIIATAEDMNAIGADSNDWGKHFLLVAGINLADYAGTQFNIIGNSATKFTGVFDGNGYTISNFTYSSTGMSYTGIFGYVDDANAEIRDLGLIRPIVDAGERVGSLVGQLRDGTITGCYVEGGIALGDSYVGGLVGRNTDGTIINCYAAGDVGDMGWGAQLGLGGLVGRNDGSIINCYATGNVLGGVGSERLGGLVGWNDSGGDISNCYSTGNVTGNYNSTYLGGLVGSNFGPISNCYSTGWVIVEDGDYSMVVGGFMGYNRSVIIINCYATGFVYADYPEYLGGFVGYDNSGSYTTSFWDIDTSGKTDGVGNVDPDPTGIYGKNTSQMKIQSTFTSAGWDFVDETANGTNDYWRMCVDDVNYPLLAWQFAIGDFVCPDGVNFIDYSFFAGYWLEDNCVGSNDCDGTDLDFSDTVDTNDLKIFCEYWLEGL